MRIVIIIWALLICTSFARARIDTSFANVVPETMSTTMSIADCGGCY
jgi:hypothetical protein